MLSSFPISEPSFLVLSSQLLQPSLADADGKIGDGADDDDNDNADDNADASDTNSSDSSNNNGSNCNERGAGASVSAGVVGSSPF